MTRAELARHLGVSRAYITKLGSQGRLVEDAGGRILLEPTLERVKETEGGFQGSEQAGAKELARERAEERLRYERARADIEEMAAAKLRAEYLATADVEKAALHQAALLRQVVEEYQARFPDNASMLRDLLEDVAVRAQLLADETANEI